MMGHTRKRFTAKQAAALLAELDDNRTVCPVMTSVLRHMPMKVHMTSLRQMTVYCLQPVMISVVVQLLPPVTCKTKLPKMHLIQVMMMTNAPAHPQRSLTTACQLPMTPAAKEIDHAHTVEFMRSVFDSPTKSRHLEIANKIKQLESERHRTSNRVRKQKQQIRDLAAALEENETRCAQLEEQIRKLKLEQAAQ